MASEQRLYTFSQPTKDALRKFRLGTSRAKEPQAVIYTINKQTLEIAPAAPAETYTSLQALADDLPDNSPRFALLSYPTSTKDGRVAVPYVLLSYMPATCNAEQRMLYAGARELFRATAEAGRVLEVGDEEDVLGVADTLGGGE